MFAWVKFQVTGWAVAQAGLASPITPTTGAATNRAPAKTLASFTSIYFGAPAALSFFRPGAGWATVSGVVDAPGPRILLGWLTPPGVSREVECGLSMRSRSSAVGAVALVLGLAACGHSAGTHAVVNPTQATTATTAAGTSPPTTLSEPTSTAPATTVVQRFEAWTSSGEVASGLHVSASVTGHCWTSSEAVSSSSAFRCMSGNDIYDPCFAPSSTATRVLCVAAPWEPEVRMMQLTQTLPAQTGPSITSITPWGFQLANGSLCELVQGAGSSVDGIALTYTCGPSSGGAGKLDTSSEPWTVQYTDNVTSGPVSTVAVTSAWV